MRPWRTTTPWLSGPMKARNASSFDSLSPTLAGATRAHERPGKMGVGGGARAARAPDGLADAAAQAPRDRRREDARRRVRLEMIFQLLDAKAQKPLAPAADGTAPSPSVASAEAAKGGRTPAQQPKPKHPSPARSAGPKTPSSASEPTTDMEQDINKDKFKNLIFYKTLKKISLSK